MAIADLTAAIRIDPKYGDAYYARGLSYKEKGEGRKWREDFAKVARLMADSGSEEAGPVPEPPSKDPK